MKILKAWWSAMGEISLALSKDCEKIPEFKLSGNSIPVNFTAERISKHNFAKYTSYYIDGGKLHFMLGSANFENFCDDPCMDYYVCGDFNAWSGLGKPEWRMRETGSSDFQRQLSVDVSALDLKRRGASFKFVSSSGVWLEARPDAPNAVFDKSGNMNLGLSLDRSGRNVFALKFDGVCMLGDDLSIGIPEYGISAPVDVGELLLEIYSGAKLGAYEKDGRTHFSIFAPRADAVYVRVWTSGDKQERLLQASTSDGAVWTAAADADLRGAYYFFHIDGKNRNASSAFDAHFSVADPYANAMLSSSGPSIVKYESDLPKAADFKPPSWNNLVVMEIHLRDILSRAPAKLEGRQRETFAGLIKWLSDKSCYIRQTGVNCVELQPVQEFTAAAASDYEWGYMPVNWFSPSSSYATNPGDASQNDEFAELVRAFHNAGISVILDVVYNHVGEPNYLERVDKEYYFETTSDFGFINFSGCGNDFRAHAPMSRRMILDSLKTFMVRYGVDGFRFDLAELLGLRLLKEIERELKKIKPSVILIAEPWSFRGHISGALRQTGFASWNDGFREFMLSYAKGGGNFDGFKYFMAGSMGGTSRWPSQSVNYIESHDDMCLFDRISPRRDNPSLEDINRYKIACALILLSHGIPMLAEGFDLMRSKGGKSNTYKDGVANALDYSRSARFAGLRDWLRSLVKFRLSDSGAALRPYHPVCDGFFKFYSGSPSPAAAALFNADRSMNCAPSIFVAFNPSLDSADIPIGGDIEGFVHIADIDRFDIRGLADDFHAVKSGILTLPPLSLYIALKH